MKLHCVVIGAGIVGVSCAYHLQARGFDVTLVDPELPGQSCSFGNAACIATSGVVPLSSRGLIRKLPRWLLDPLGPVSLRLGFLPSMLPWLKHFRRISDIEVIRKLAVSHASLMKPALTDYDEILSATGLAHLKASPGAIHVYDTQADFQADLWQLDMSAELGFEYRRLSPAELKSMVPCLRLDNGVGILLPGWHHLLDPAKVTAGIAEHCFRNGAQWLHQRVASVNAESSGLSVTTDSGRCIKADRLVIAAGAWSNDLAGQLDDRVPMIAKRGYHSQLSNPGITLNHPVMSANGAFVMTPQENGLRIAGTAEFAALDARPDYRRARVLLKQASRYLEGLDTSSGTEWMGQRPMMPDSLPVISASPCQGNVFYAFGHGHYGITQGPTTGRIIADMMSGEQPTVDLEAFRFDRF